MDEVTKRGPGRPPRAEQERTARRRRDDGALAAAKRLPIPPEVEARMKAEGRVTRWANDEGNRIHRLTVQDDYDKVEGVDPVPIGLGVDGKPILAHLLSKPKAYFDEDQAKQQRKISETESKLFERPDAAEAAAKDRNPNPATAERYLDKSANISRQGNQILEG